MRWMTVVCCALALGALGACGDDDSTAGGISGKGSAGKSAKGDAGKDAGASVKPDGDGAVAVEHDSGADEEHPAGQGEGLSATFMADAGNGFKSLIQAHWIVPPNSEQYRCARLTVTKDVTLNVFRTLSPLGTHHTVLTVDKNPAMPDGLTVCNVGTNAAGGLFGSGVGTNDYTLPEGLAIRLHKGEQLLVNLHLFNVTDKPLEGTSGTLVKELPDAQVKNEVEAILGGPTTINVPPHETGVKQAGDCTMTQDFTLIAVLPHAHMHATHMKVTAMSSIDGDVVIHDADYTFDAQLVYPIDPVKMKKGDKVHVECTYDNNSDKPITFGDSSLAEMCFAGVWRYPAAADPNFFCKN